MKIKVLGNGFVANHLDYNKITDRLSVSETEIDNLINREKPDVLINCIGKTGRPNVDSCEDEKEITSAINVSLPILLAKTCQKHSIKLIHIGSGCIFFGISPYVETAAMTNAIVKDYGWKETDIANPKSFYSKTKYACDLAIGDMSHVSILRIRMPISEERSERNLIYKLSNYNKVIDIPNSITYMRDLSRFVNFVIDKDLNGIYHVTNPSPTTAAKIMLEYQKYVPSHSFNTIDESELDRITKAKRSNCILNTDKLKSTGFIMTSTDLVIKNCVKSYCY